MTDIDIRPRTFFTPEQEADLFKRLPELRKPPERLKVLQAVAYIDFYLSKSAVGTIDSLTADARRDRRNRFNDMVSRMEKISEELAALASGDVRVCFPQPGDNLERLRFLVDDPNVSRGWRVPELDGNQAIKRAAGEALHPLKRFIETLAEQNQAFNAPLDRGRPQGDAAGIVALTLRAWERYVGKPSTYYSNRGFIAVEWVLETLGLPKRKDPKREKDPSRQVRAALKKIERERREDPLRWVKAELKRRRQHRKIKNI